MVSNILLSIGLIIAGIGQIILMIKNPMGFGNRWGEKTNLIICGIAFVIFGIIILCKAL